MKNVLMNRLRVSFENGKLVASTYVTGMEEAEHYAALSGQTCEISELCEDELIDEGLTYCVKWYSTDAIDLLGALDEGYYGAVLNAEVSHAPVCRFRKSRADAQVPKKAHASDSGYDVVLLECIKTVGDVKFYTTGIQVDPPHGYYFDLVARSSISKTGHMLANSVGIIDQNYRGDIVVPLRKVDGESPDIELPCKLAQLVPRRWHSVQMIETDELDASSRGAEGFGSTS